ncbi:Uu.00g093570.m01.CDS01 [Anthostomella pinea]|uniref:Uu.00g093570.m01.CDS01 n=1 Tax=Anthostomella pinea TaxID=933095 RepID=A0AAI8VPF5_9PEZI|nr:Uu.00g093570.m01.CDS01 [Anthostomella pinea]
MPWARLMRLLVRKEATPLNGLNPLFALRNLWEPWALDQKDKKSHHIIDLLQTFDDSECADPKDRVYALCGLADDVVILRDGQQIEPGAQVQQKITI